MMACLVPWWLPSAITSSSQRCRRLNALLLEVPGIQGALPCSTFCIAAGGHGVPHLRIHQCVTAAPPQPCTVPSSVTSGSPKAMGLGPTAPREVWPEWRMNFQRPQHESLDPACSHLGQSSDFDTGVSVYSAFTSNCTAQNNEPQLSKITIILP